MGAGVVVLMGNYMLVASFFSYPVVRYILAGNSLFAVMTMMVEVVAVVCLVGVAASDRLEACVLTIVEETAVLGTGVSYATPPEEHLCEYMVMILGGILVVGMDLFYATPQGEHLSENIVCCVHAWFYSFCIYSRHL